MKVFTGPVGFPLIRIVDATFAVAAPPPAFSMIPCGDVSSVLTMMVVPRRVVTVADPGLSVLTVVAKMPPEKKPPCTSIVPLR
jgi:hypothetical protein